MVIPFLSKIGTKSYTSNKLSGFTEGTVSPKSEFYITLGSIFQLTFDSMCLAFTETEFHHTVSRDYHQILITIRSILISCGVVFIDKSNEINIPESAEPHLVITRILANLKVIFRFNDVPFWSGRLPSSILSEIGIFRFRNGGGTDRYIAQQSMLQGPDANHIDFYACFFFLFKPTFDINQHLLVQGDVEVDVNVMPALEAWSYYLSFVTVPKSYSGLDDSGYLKSPSGNRGYQKGSNAIQHNQKDTPRGPKSQQPPIGGKKSVDIEKQEYSTQSGNYMSAVLVGVSGRRVVQYFYQRPIPGFCSPFLKII
jgi:hypothetical protein